LEISQLKFLESLVLIALYVFAKIISGRVVDKTIVNQIIQKPSGKIIKKAISVTLLTVIGVLILVVWGVDQTELAVFVGSVLTVIGIALFAQWSILSNITSSIIIFFNSSIKLDDTITIMDKDYEVEGRVSDIGLFFVTLKTPEGDQIFLPNNVFIQKMIKKAHK